MILGYRILQIYLAWDPVWRTYLRVCRPRIFKISAARLMLENSKIKQNTHVLGVYLIWFRGKGLFFNQV